MDEAQIIAQTINDIDDFVVRLSDNLNEEILQQLQNYKQLIRENLDNNNLEEAKEYCRQVIGFMQNLEIQIIENQQKSDEQQALHELMNQSVSLASNSTISDGKIVPNKSSFFRNFYYKYFYKWYKWESEIDDETMVYDFVDNIYSLTLWSLAIVIALLFASQFYDYDTHNYYMMIVLWWFAFALRLAKITKTSSNISIIFDLFIIWCFIFGFYFFRLFFALS